MQEGYRFGMLWLTNIALSPREQWTYAQDRVMNDFKLFFFFDFFTLVY